MIVSARATNVRPVCGVPCPRLLLIVCAGCVTISILPDDVLLNIFLFDRASYDTYLDYGRLTLSWGWNRLVHVCHKWRSIIFESPIVFDLKLVCRPWTRRGLTGVWPSLPIVITNVIDVSMPKDYSFEAVTVHRNRVREMKLVRLSSQLVKRVISVMQDQFPELIHFFLGIDRFLAFISREAFPILPDGFLVESATRLQSLRLRHTAFPTLPKLLLSATDLVHLDLKYIPHSGYFSPQAIVTGLAALANLESLHIGFESPQSRPKQGSRLLPPQTRTVLPALSRFEFRGVSEYLEDLVSRIDAPLLDSILITFFHQLIFDIPQLAQFMGRTTRFQALDGVHLEFEYSSVHVGYLPPVQSYEEKSGLEISCRKLDWQLSSLTQVFTPLFPSIYMVEDLYIYEPSWPHSKWPQDIENMQWLEVFHPFTSVKNLYVCRELAQSISLALQELIEVLPTLRALFLQELQESGPEQKAIGEFVAARQLLGHPVAVSHWDRARRYP